MVEEVAMRDRVIGVENEFGAVIDGVSEEGTYERIALARSSLLDNRLNSRGKDGTIGIRGKDPNPNRLWLLNGGCFYVDQAHLEYNSPECRRVKDAVRFNKAGELLALEIAKNPPSSCKKIIFVKHNVARNINYHPGLNAQPEPRVITFGTHENYLFFGKNPSIVHDELNNYPLEADRARFLPFIAFLATRQIIDGSGIWEDPDKEQFSFSQRAAFIDHEIGSSTTNNRHMITAKEDHLVSHLLAPKMNRLHLILGDANILDTALFLKLGTTSLVLALMEDGRMPDIQIRNGVGELRDISASYDVHFPSVKMLKQSKRPMSALSVQSLFCERADEYVKETWFESEESEAEARAIVSLWEDALTALSRNDRKWMLGRLDHATKKFIAEKMIAESKKAGDNESESKIRERVEFRYHALGPLGMQNKLRAAWKKRCIVSDADMARAVSIPPKDTRAFARGCAIRLAIDGKLRRPLRGCDWDKLRIGTKDSFVDCDMGNPFQTEFDWSKEVFSSVET